MTNANTNNKYINTCTKDGKASHLEKGSASELRAHTYHNSLSLSLSKVVCYLVHRNLPGICNGCRNVEITRFATSSCSFSVAACSCVISSEIRLEHTQRYVQCNVLASLILFFFHFTMFSSLPTANSRICVFLVLCVNFDSCSVVVGGSEVSEAEDLC